MSVLGDLLTESTAGLASELFGEFDESAWSRCADVETKQQASQAVTYTAVEGCVWHPAEPDLKTDDERRRQLLTGTLLVPTSLELTLSVKDRWQDADDIVWRPQTISGDIHGFRHVLLSTEARQFSGQTKRRG